MLQKKGGTLRVPSYHKELKLKKLLHLETLLFEGFRNTWLVIKLKILISDLQDRCPNFSRPDALEQFHNSRVRHSIIFQISFYSQITD